MRHRVPEHWYILCIVTTSKQAPFLSGSRSGDQNDTFYDNWESMVTLEPKKTIIHTSALVLDIYSLVYHLIGVASPQLLYCVYHSRIQN